MARFFLLSILIAQAKGSNITFPSVAFSPFGGLPFQIGLDFSDIFQGSTSSSAINFLINTFIDGGRNNSLSTFLSNLKPSDAGKSITLPNPLKVLIQTKVQNQLQNLNFTTSVLFDNLTVVLANLSEAKEDPCTAQKLAVVKNVSMAVVRNKLENRFGNPDEEQEQSDFSKKREEFQVTYNYTQEDVIVALEQVLNAAPVQLVIRNQLFPQCGNSSAFTGDEFSELSISQGTRAILYTVFALIICTFIYAIRCAGCFMGCCCLPDKVESDEETEFWDKFDPLFKSPVLPEYMRYYIFFIAVAVNVAFFISANASVGATINVSYSVAGITTDLPSIYDFSMLKSTVQMLKAGVILLGIILMGFSVFWPYVKLVILTVVWVLPTHLIRPKRRECLLIWLDALGKWSMFDVFALCIMMVVFRVVIVSPEWFVFPLGFYGVTLSMACAWGMYSNLIAQIISQVVSIYAIDSHRKVYRSDWYRIKEEENKKLEALKYDDAVEKGETVQDGVKSLEQSSEVSRDKDNLKSIDTAEDINNNEPQEEFEIPPYDETVPLYDKVSITKEGVAIEATNALKVLVALLITATAIMIATAFFVDGFHVSVVGLMGLVQEAATPGSSTIYYSPLVIAKELNNTIPPNSPGQALGTWALILVMSFCTSAVPIAQALALLTLWAKPLSLQRMKQLLLANEMLASWQYIEVYLIAVIVGCAQLPLICSLIVSKACADIKPALNELVATGVMSHPTCLSMTTRVDSGIWLHFLGAIFLYVCSVAVREPARRVVAMYDSFEKEQMQQEILTEKQTSYYHRRTMRLVQLKFVKIINLKVT